MIFRIFQAVSLRRDNEKIRFGELTSNWRKHYWRKVKNFGEVGKIRKKVAFLEKTGIICNVHLTKAACTTEKYKKIVQPMTK